MKRLLAIAVAGAALAAVGRGGAAWSAPALPADTPDETAVAATLDALGRTLAANYLFPDVGQRYAAALRAWGAAGRFDGLRSDEALAAAITAELQTVAPDKHLALRVNREAPPAPGTAAPAEPAISGTRWLAPGVAYVGFNNFLGNESAEAVGRFMRAYAGAHTLIIDARRHRGGGIAPIDVMLPYLYRRATTLVQMDTRAAAAARMPFLASTSLQKIDAPPTVDRRLHRVQPHPTERRWFAARIFYLTSSRTASAAEHLALALKRTGRATLVGETTRGAGHFGSLQPIGSRFTAFVPIGRTYDPVTGEGWEGTGITPDIRVAAEDALDTALRAAQRGTRPGTASATVRPRAPRADR